MKSVNPLLFLVIFFICFGSINAQYYQASRKNKALLITNAYSTDKIPVLTNSVEYGRQLYRLLFHGGFAVSNMILKGNLPNDDVKTLNSNKPNYDALLGLDLNVIGFPILNLSHKTYCKYFGGSLNIGFDTFKNLQTTLASDFGYRAKAYLAFSILRTGSYKKDIGYRRYVQLGYFYTDNNIEASNIKPYHGLMLNILIVKKRLIKFANWY
jgi:hypothetical protein